MAKAISDLYAREIPDSRGILTLEVSVSDGENVVSTQVPSGKSAGSHEAIELRDKDDGGVTEASDNIKNIIRPQLVGMVPDQKEIDRLLLQLDGTPDKSHLGGNTLIGISTAVGRLAAKQEGVPLWRHISEITDSKPSFPALFMNIINGGVHADFRLPFQEYMVVISGDSPKLSFENGKSIFSSLEKIISEKYGEVPIGDEGGYSPKCDSLEEPFEILKELVSQQASVSLAIDAAASEFYKDGLYELLGRKYSSAELVLVYKELLEKYRLLSIEDPFAEDDGQSFRQLLSQTEGRTFIVGDDLTTTNPNRVKWAVENKLADAMIVKPNQIGTLTETFEAVSLARNAGWKLIVSHRSGDTMDDFIADLSVGIGAFGMKAGSPNPPERVAKYKRLADIELEML
ncbi:MAG: hypothetical protein A2653_01515 [Candidatus Zambryskibacteria bacterium RIFCSPHIGHO2_01_FULL_43_25]|uniref:Enolase n=1 Tax=Candidatus Zambryskibacteria bacterium RIFCSPLOWO2_01_FULL_45_21 TaxID=1802761 RepID=A0A1G2U3U3_9BACT|nr:MAG: hypothetical protein A2653_01515 [Candidatus Zambryskibacteria bacterium RIFCSPHIGHO2_01_FULL_43_25]OHB00368.1 MAG: hypothetical protein A3E94_01525 [Candidatus Zambryskibacteria bacterium RIFCSPHIGHO2_12_FULL_44_12b]OHB04163.1 MAG: hypothetical protein A3B14_01995 [Candidatus Zambryskibacteria bacterium RIFCSPLOWO2_01_FULL_45_21]